MKEFDTAYVSEGKEAGRVQKYAENTKKHFRETACNFRVCTDQTCRNGDGVAEVKKQQLIS